MKIEEIDHFLAKQTVSRATRNIHRYCLPGFLRWLHRERRMMKKELASLPVGPRCFAEQKPPKFLRPQEVQKLFASLPLSTPSEIRTYAIVLLVYTLGLRPAEISTITLDTISFRKAELTLPNRKALKTVILSEYGSGLSFGPGSATRKVGQNEPIEDCLSYPGARVVSNSRGMTPCTLGSCAYLQNDRNACYAFET